MRERERERERGGGGAENYSQIAWAHSMEENQISDMMKAAKCRHPRSFHLLDVISIILEA